MKADLQRARAMLEQASSIAVVAHERPDGDAIGSMLALTLSLRLRQQAAIPVLAGGLPARYRFLPGSQDVEATVPPGNPLLVTVDAADVERIGLPLEDGLRIGINFDHHPSNTLFADLNIVDPQAASTTELLYLLAPELGLPIDASVAANLLTGLITDTLGFRTASVRPGTLEVAARLMEEGASLQELYAKSLVQRSFLALRYWGRGLVRLERRDGIVWATLTLDDRASAGYPGPDDADLIDLLTTIQEADVALVFVEQLDGQIKVSWRARQGHDVAGVAAQFGGGGHLLAAGAMVEGEIDEVIGRVIGTTEEMLLKGST